jgi:hypothetical protein
MGGNVFGTTSGIKKEHIQSTLNGFIDELCRIFPLRKEYLESYKVLGSAGKKDVSGDIDLALSNDLVKDSKSWGISQTRVLEYYDKFVKRARTATHEQLMKRAFIVSIADVIESESEMIGVDTKGSGSGSLFCTFPQLDENGDQVGMNVQIDINFGDLDWLEFAYYSDVYEGNVKGLHRTQLMLSLFTYKGYTFSHNYGVKNKDTQEIVASNSEQAIKLLSDEYNMRFDRDILSNFFKLYEVVKNDIKKSNEIFDIYLKILDSTRCDVPYPLHQFWRDNQERLGLTGKFLPDDSKLK